jgi:hypothetical protein
VIVDFSVSDVVPERRAVLQSLGIPPRATVPRHIEDLYQEGLQRFTETAAPIGIVDPIGIEEFNAVFAGEGLNEPDALVGDVFPRAAHLALFAVTVGGLTSQAITEGFETKDFAVASMLDALASESADMAAEVLERRYEDQLRAQGWNGSDGGVLRYSPGYCGWNVTGQKRLFRYLEPERIGLTLTDSCLMQPLKSVSGVIIAGSKAIHQFKPTYSYCSTCETHACRERLRALRER